MANIDGFHPRSSWGAPGYEITLHESDTFPTVYRVRTAVECAPGIVCDVDHADFGKAFDYAQSIFRGIETSLADREERTGMCLIR